MPGIDLEKRIQAAADKLEIRESEIHKFLGILWDKRKLHSYTLLRMLGMSKAHMGRLLKEFADLLEPVSENIEIKKEAMDSVQELLDSVEFGLNAQRQKVTNLLNRYHTQRPASERDFDQFTATVQTTVKRAIYLQSRGDLRGRKIVFLGDDDLTSVAVAFLNLASRIVVLEIDSRIIELIKTISTEHNLNIETLKYDLRSPVPDNLRQEFNVVFTDPPYTPAGISLFLNRAIDCIQPQFTSRIYLCYGNSDRARERELKIQQLVIDRGLLINTKLFQFNKYHAAESIGSTSSLYLCDWTPQTHKTKVDQGRIYTHE